MFVCRQQPLNETVKGPVDYAVYWKLLESDSRRLKWQGDKEGLARGGVKVLGKRVTEVDREIWQNYRKAWFGNQNFY